MFSLNDTMRYFLCPSRTDMRKGISSLCGLVHEKMKSEVRNGDVSNMRSRTTRGFRPRDRKVWRWITCY